MSFEFDAEKSAPNKKRHSIGLVEAQALWNDPLLIVAPARSDDEERFLAVGCIGMKHWSAVHALREDRIRLISVRRSRPQEVEYYEGE
ncbi:MAG: BrnT family toxin [Mesorhizobium sp.]|nr:BrnT family toxin [Mesorhizobium sp.]MCO5162547.1 BrnT family toxin [Mesorhizobium sp.]